MSLIPVRLSHILIEEHSDAQSVSLRSDDDRRLTIAIGPVEAGAIRRAVTGDTFDRPLTHDLLVALVTATGHRLVAIRIVDLRDDVYYAELVLEDAQGREVVVDSRPSDAIAVAARSSEVPIFVADHVLAAAGDAS